MPPRPGPVQADSRKVVLAGTALFALALVVLLPFWTWLGTHHHRVWLETALAGVLLGLLGMHTLARHRREGRTR